MESRLKLYLSSITIIFLFLGVIYCSAFYGHFGIAIWNFFSLEDYLKGSLHSVAALVLGILSGFYFAHFDNTIRDFINLVSGKNETKESDTDDKTFEDIFRELASLRHLKEHKSNVVIFFLALLTSLIFTFIYISPVRYFFYSFSLMFVVYIIVDIYFKSRVVFYLIIKRKDKNLALFVANMIDVLILILFITVGFAFTSADTIMSTPKTAKIQITFSTPVAIPQDKIVSIGASKEYFFFYDKSVKKSYIVPRKDILMIEQDKPDEHFLDSLKSFFGIG